MEKQSLVSYLKDPYLIAKVQGAFGVERIDKDRWKSETRVDKASKDYKNYGRDYETEKVVATDALNKTYVIKSWFWYYLFVFGATLEDESFKIVYFPCWFWNVDSATGRRVLFIWVVAFTLGQMLKDLIKWPRPACPPAVRLENKWYNEYGMPSTHAMVGVAVPFSLLICTYGRYEYNMMYGIIIACVWTTLVCVSRFYLGMHTVADVIAGILLSVLLLIIFIPCVDMIDGFLLTSPLSPLVMFFVSTSVLIFHPTSEFWTPTRGDTAVIVGGSVGVYFASWVQYEYGIIRGPPMSPPFMVMWPSTEMLVLCVLRTIIGLTIAFLTRFITKPASIAVVQAIFRPDKKSQDTRVEVSYKFVTYFLVGFNIIFTSSAMFHLFGIHRPSMYTEV